MECGDFLDYLLFGCIVDMKGATEGIKHELLGVSVGGENTEGRGEVADELGLVPLPKPLLVG